MYRVLVKEKARCSAIAVNIHNEKNMKSIQKYLQSDLGR